MMSQLWIVKVVGEPARLAEFMVTGLEESPDWFLHGTTVLYHEKGVDYAGGQRAIAVWGEQSRSFKQDFEGLTFDDVTLPSEEDMKRILRDAAVRAIKLAVTDKAITDLGEVLLRRHPACRNEATSEDAIIAAALAERAACYTEDDYAC